MPATETREWNYRFFQGANLVFMFALPLYLLFGLGLVLGGGYVISYSKWSWFLLLPIGMILMGLFFLWMLVFIARQAVCDLGSGRVTVRLTDDGISAPRDRWARTAEFVPFTAVRACWFESLTPTNPDDTAVYFSFVLHTTAGQWHILKQKMPSPSTFFECAKLIRAHLPQLGDPTVAIPLLQWGNVYDWKPGPAPDGSSGGVG